MTRHQRVMHLLQDAHVNRWFAAGAEADDEYVAAFNFRLEANAQERRAGELLARPLVPGVQEVMP